MTLAKDDPLSMKYGFDVGVYNLNSKGILAQTVKQKIFVCIDTKTNSVYSGI